MRRALEQRRQPARHGAAFGNAGSRSAIPDDDDPAEAPEDPFLTIPTNDAEDEATTGDDFLETEDDAKQGLAGETTELPALEQARSGGVKHNTDTYTRTGWRFVSDLQACIKYTFSGKVTYTSEKLDMGGGQKGYRLRNITFVAPKTSTAVYRYDPGNHACTTREFKVKKLSVANVYSGYSCNWNPQVSVGVPFGVSFGFWPSCGDRRSARYTASLENTTHMTQTNQDTRIHYRDQVKFNQGGAPPKFNCYGTALKAKITAGHTVASVKTPRRKICLSPTW